eukprot:Rmarinus@m.718
MGDADSEAKNDTDSPTSQVLALTKLLNIDSSARNETPARADLPALLSALEDLSPQATFPDDVDSSLEAFLVEHAHEYDFSSELYAQLLRALASLRFQDTKWLKKTTSAHHLRICQCIRLLTRDETLRREFLKLDAHIALCTIFQELAANHFDQERVAEFGSDALGEIANTVKKTYSCQS